MQRVVGIGEMIISNNIEDTIKTFALASCVGVVAYSSFRKVGGMIHIVLPEPPINVGWDSRRCYYASTGIPRLINGMCKEYGCLKGELRINIFGGANSIRSNDIFNVGRKNIDAVRYILNEMCLNFNDVETGKTVSRTVELDVLTGQIFIRYQEIVI